MTADARSVGVPSHLPHLLSQSLGILHQVYPPFFFCQSLIVSSDIDFFFICFIIYLNPQTAGAARLNILPRSKSRCFKTAATRFFIMLTRKEKKQVIDKSAADLEKSRSLLFVDFSGAKTKEITELRRSLKKINARLDVIKKKLLRIAFERIGKKFDPEVFESQAATIFSKEEIYGIAAAAEKAKSVKILGGFDLKTDEFFDAEKAIFFGKLPSREILLGQLVGTIASPIRALLYILSERSKKTA